MKIPVIRFFQKYWSQLQVILAANFTDNNAFLPGFPVLLNGVGIPAIYMLFLKGISGLLAVIGIFGPVFVMNFVTEG